MEFARFDQNTPESLNDWHRWYVFWPVRAKEGWTIGRVWRRWRGVEWEYSKREWWQMRWRD
jgi:hypothetical protein